MRHALYLMPDPASTLWRAASALIGHDSATGLDVPQPDLPGIDAADLREATEDPRRYGFHMTLKAPFRLAQGMSEAALRAALHVFCQTRAGFEAGALALEARVGPDGRGFVCLVPKAPCPALFLLEQEVVRAFEPFRAPLNAQEIARRRPETLEPRQRALLDAYGYPFVLDEFRPHFSLTGQVDEPERWRAQLAKWLAAQVPEAGISITGIGLFRQDDAQGRFRLVAFEDFSAIR